MSPQLIIYIIKVSIYLVSFVFTGLGTGALLWNNFLNPKKPFEATVFFFLINFALTFLVGSLVIALLGLELWIR